MKIYANGFGHMRKMAARLIKGKNPLKATSEQESQYPWDLVCSIWDMGPSKFVQMMILC